MALPSSGLHTNGFSLARKALGVDADLEEARERLGGYHESLGRTLGEALVEPHRCYLAELRPLLDRPERPVKGMAHITGGGLVDNIPRALPDRCAVELYEDAWQVPPVFGLIQEQGRIDPSEMPRVFNMGLGMVLIVAPEDRSLVDEVAPSSICVGKVIQRREDRQVIFTNHR